MILELYTAANNFIHTLKKTSIENENANNWIKGFQCPNFEEWPHINATLDKLA